MCTVTIDDSEWHYSPACSMRAERVHPRYTCLNLEGFEVLLLRRERIRACGRPESVPLCQLHGIPSRSCLGCGSFSSSTTSLPGMIKRPRRAHDLPGSSPLIWSSAWTGGVEITRSQSSTASGNKKTAGLSGYHRMTSSRKAFGITISTLGRDSRSSSSLANRASTINGDALTTRI